MDEPLHTILPWVLTYSLIIIGLIGAFIPVIPSHFCLLGAAIAHYTLLAPHSGLGIPSIVILAILLIISQLFEMMSSSLGSKWFGGGKWGILGATLGVLAGLFFPPFGIFIGPLIGALLFEKLIAKKDIKAATRSGVGSAVGTLSGMAVRMVTAFIMTLYLLLDIYLLK